MTDDAEHEETERRYQLIRAEILRLYYLSAAAKQLRPGIRASTAERNLIELGELNDVLNPGGSFSQAYFRLTHPEHPDDRWGHVFVGLEDPDLRPGVEVDEPRSFRPVRGSEHLAPPPPEVLRKRPELADRFPALHRLVPTRPVRVSVPSPVEHSDRVPRPPALADGDGRSTAVFVTSRSFELPTSAEDMDRSVWFNLWRARLWPYVELRDGDELWWYETPSQRIVWRTRVTQIDAFEYSSLEDALGRIDAEFDDDIDRSQPYLHDKPDQGFCLAYRVAVVDRLDVPKPPGVRFSQQGWERATRPEIAAWVDASNSLQPAGESGANPHWTRSYNQNLWIAGLTVGAAYLPRCLVDQNESRR